MISANKLSIGVLEAPSRRSSLQPQPPSSSAAAALAGAPPAPLVVPPAPLVVPPASLLVVLPPDGMLHVMRRRSGVHGALCGSGRLDDMIDTARGTTDPVERERQYRDIELLLEDDARLLPLFHPTRRTVLGRRVRTTAKKRLLVRAADCAELWIPARR